MSARGLGEIWHSAVAEASPSVISRLCVGRTNAHVHECDSPCVIVQCGSDCVFVPARIPGARLTKKIAV